MIKLLYPYYWIHYDMAGGEGGGDEGGGGEEGGDEGGGDPSPGPPGSGARVRRRARRVRGRDSGRD